MRLLFIDISKYNNVPDWGALAASGIAGTILKVSEGFYPDPLIDIRAHLSESTQLFRAGYHFPIPTQDPVKQAGVYLQHAKGFELPDWLDMEWMKITHPVTGKVLREELWNNLTAAERVQFALTFLKTVEAGSGKRPGIYTNKAFWDQFMVGAPGVEELYEYPLWDNSFSNPNVPTLIPHFDNPEFVQFTDKGNIGGVTPVDLDYFMGTINDMWAFAGFSIEQNPSEYNGKVAAFQKVIGANPDGKFGITETLPALIKWQEANGMVADGIITPELWQKMFKVKTY